MVYRVLIIDNDQKVRTDIYAALERANRIHKDVHNTKENKFVPYTAASANSAEAKVGLALFNDWQIGDEVYVLQDIIMNEGSEEGLREITAWDSLTKSGEKLEGRLSGLIVYSSVANAVSDRPEVTEVRNFPVFICNKRLTMGSYGPKAVELIESVIHNEAEAVNPKISSF
ncbi:hypothetical protein J4223_02395 [Candidatus Woesearchaeota archaeon]|nr:hypothetical protein [Candidatus Woesearchaeota archaeon]